MSSPPPPCISSDIPRLRFNFPTQLPIGSTLLLLSTNSSSEKREGDTDTAKKYAGMSTRFINNSRFFSISGPYQLMWHLRNVRRGRWEIFKGRQYHSPYFTWAPLVASTFTKEYLPVNSFNIRILQTHIAISLLVIFAVVKKNSWEFLSPIIQYPLTIFAFLKKGIFFCEFLSSDISIFPDKWIMAASWANNEPLCRSSNSWNFNPLCTLSTIYDTAKKL